MKRLYYVKRIYLQSINKLKDEESFKRETDGKIANISWKHRINEHSDDDVNEYVVYGSIYFYDGDDLRSLFYCYGNVNHMDNAEYYRKHGLGDMVESEVTNIFLKYWGNSVDIIKEIAVGFGFIGCCR